MRLPQDRRARAKRDAAWRKERRKYGRTEGGRWVDVEPLTRLVDMGYDKWVAWPHSSSSCPFPGLCLKWMAKTAEL